MEAFIHFFSEEIDFLLEDEKLVEAWIVDLIKQNQRLIQELNIVFVSDEYLLEMNQKHLDHDYYTDILTFAYEENPVYADIFISIDRVKDNATQLQFPFKQELHRVIAHGVLHILGYDDHEENDISEMRAQEEYALSLRSAALIG